MGGAGKAELVRVNSVVCSAFVSHQVRPFGMPTSGEANAAAAAASAVEGAAGALEILEPDDLLPICAHLRRHIYDYVCKYLCTYM